MADDLQSRSEQWQIRVRDLRKSFGSQHVLRGVNLDIERRKINIIIGGSGQGKCRFSRNSTSCLSRMFVMGRTHFPRLGDTLNGAGTVA
jgi:ABC-type phosphate transport system ATPase subunit